MRKYCLYYYIYYILCWFLSNLDNSIRIFKVTHAILFYLFVTIGNDGQIVDTYSAQLHFKIYHIARFRCSSTYRFWDLAQKTSEKDSMRYLRCLIENDEILVYLLSKCYGTFLKESGKFYRNVTFSLFP